MLNYLIHAKIIKNINMHERSFNNSWRRLPGYLQGQQNQLAEALIERAKKYLLTVPNKMPY